MTCERTSCTSSPSLVPIEWLGETFPWLEGHGLIWSKSKLKLYPNTTNTRRTNIVVSYTVYDLEVFSHNPTSWTAASCHTHGTHVVAAGWGY
jgi:hypothetical protein